MEKKPGISLGELIAGAAAVLFIIFLFLPWAGSEFSDETASAWKIFDGTDIVFLLLSLVLITFAVLTLLSVTLPFRTQLVTSHIAIAILAIMVLLVIEDFDFTKIGFWLAFLASLAMTTGAILTLLGLGGEITLGGPRPAAAGPAPGGPGFGPPPGQYGAGGAPGQFGGPPQAAPGAGAPTQAAPGAGAPTQAAPTGGPPPGAAPGPAPTPPSTPSPGGPGPGGPPAGATRVGPSPGGPGGGPPGGGPGGPPGGAAGAETRMGPAPGAGAPSGQEPTVMGTSPGPSERPSQPTGGGTAGGGPSGGQPTGGQPSPPANWYPDPYGKSRLRYWDGSRWTDQTAE